MMLFEIRWTPEEKPMARRVDGQPLTDQDRRELKALLEKMERREVCFICGGEWTRFVNQARESFLVCWACARTI